MSIPVKTALFVCANQLPAIFATRSLIGSWFYWIWPATDDPFPSFTHFGEPAARKYRKTGRKWPNWNRHCQVHFKL